MTANKIELRVYEIIKKKNRFMTLNEIYADYMIEFGPEESESYIRRRINARCIDRDLLEADKEPLFFSILQKRSKGNQFGLYEWYSESIIIDLVQNDIEDLLEHPEVVSDYDSLELEIYDSGKKYSAIEEIQLRRHIYAVKALECANYMCECNNNHKSFVRKSNMKNYTEAHHLIPLKYQHLFKYSLDNPANIVSLCSTCHNRLHYGADIKEPLKKLYELRKKQLEDFRIPITFEELMKLYNVID